MWGTTPRNREHSKKQAKGVPTTLPAPSALHAVRSLLSRPGSVEATGRPLPKRSIFFEASALVMSSATSSPASRVAAVSGIAPRRLWAAPILRRASGAFSFSRPPSSSAHPRSRQSSAAVAVPVCVFAFRSRRPAGGDRMRPQFLRAGNRTAGGHGICAQRKPFARRSRLPFAVCRSLRLFSALAQLLLAAFTNAREAASIWSSCGPNGNIFISSKKSLFHGPRSSLTAPPSTSAASGCARSALLPVQRTPQLGDRSVRDHRVGSSSSRGYRAPTD